MRLGECVLTQDGPGDFVRSPHGIISAGKDP